MSLHTNLWHPLRLRFVGSGVGIEFVVAPMGANYFWMGSLRCLEVGLQAILRHPLRLKFGGLGVGAKIVLAPMQPNMFFWIPSDVQQFACTQNYGTL